MRKLLALVAVLAAELSSPVWIEAQIRDNEITQKIIDLVLTHNPTLLSRARIVEQARNMGEPGYGLSIPDMNISASLGFFNPTTNLFALNPSVGIGLSISFSDPARQLDVLKIKEEKESAKQEYEKARNEILSTLFSKIRELSRLRSQKKNLKDLLSYLEDYSKAAEAQRMQQSIGLDKLWDLKARITDLRIEMETLAAETDTLLQETAMGIGGDSWEEILSLLMQLNESVS
jgi:outer membrane protein TolC